MHAAWANVLNQAILFLVEVSVISLTALIHSLTPRFKQWIDHHTTLQERQVVMAIAKEAAIFAEQAFVNLSGPEKMDEAIRYSLSVLSNKGIQLNPHEVRAALEQAVYSMNNSHGSMNP